MNTTQKRTLLGVAAAVVLGGAIASTGFMGAYAAAAAPPFTQLTSGGCCVQAVVHPDGKRVMFIDKPSPSQPTALYAVPIDGAAGGSTAPVMLTQQLGPFSAGMRYAADLVNGQTVVTRLSDGARKTIPNDGRRVTFSPDASMVLWQVSEQAGNFDVRRSDIWVATIDGGSPRRVGTRFGGGVVAWFPDGKRILVSGKTKRNAELPSFGVMDLATGDVRTLVTTERIRGALLSPDGRWLAYYVAQARDSQQNGMFMLDTAGPGAPPRRLDVFGAYRWRAGNQLLMVPLRLGQPGSELLQVDPATGASRQLIAPSGESPFRIANGDWDVSPDGSRLIFLSAKDRNIWTTRLPN